jgi:hypothetical protein
MEINTFPLITKQMIDKRDWNFSPELLTPMVLIVINLMDMILFKKIKF